MATTEVYVKACPPGGRRDAVLAWLAAARQLVPVFDLCIIVSDYAGLLLMRANDAPGMVRFKLCTTSLVPRQTIYAVDLDSSGHTKVQCYDTYDVPLFGHVEIPREPIRFDSPDRTCTAWLCPDARFEFLAAVRVSCVYAQTHALTVVLEQPGCALYTLAAPTARGFYKAPCSGAGTPVKVTHPVRAAPHHAPGSMVIEFAVHISARLGLITEGAEGACAKTSEDGAVWIRVGSGAARLVVLP